MVLDSLYIIFSTQIECSVPRVAVKDFPYDSKVTNNFYFLKLDRDRYVQIHTKYTITYTHIQPKYIGDATSLMISEVKQR